MYCAVSSTPGTPNNYPFALLTEKGLKYLNSSCDKVKGTKVTDRHAWEKSCGSGGTTKLDQYFLDDLTMCAITGSGSGMGKIGSVCGKQPNNVEALCLTYW